VALFADQSFYDENVGNTDLLATVDYNNKTFFPMELTIMKYYLLVLFSLTGPCTLLGQTQVLRAVDGLNETLPQQTIDSVVVRSTATKDLLSIPCNVLDYIRRQSVNLDKVNDQVVTSSTNSLPPNGGDDNNNNLIVVLKRRFEFDFGGYLSVMMLHLVCSRGRMHLVEVYRFQTEKSLLGRVVSLVLQTLRCFDAFFLDRKTSVLRGQKNLRNKSIL
jgi:hypothetical protein